MLSSDAKAGERNLSNLEQIKKELEVELLTAVADGSSYHLTLTKFYCPYWYIILPFTMV